MSKWISLPACGKDGRTLLNLDKFTRIYLDEGSDGDTKLYYIIFRNVEMQYTISFKSQKKRNRAYENIKCFIPRPNESILSLESDLQYS